MIWWFDPGQSPVTLADGFAELEVGGEIDVVDDAERSPVAEEVISKLGRDGV
jgi:hypothetical protein